MWELRPNPRCHANSSSNVRRPRATVSAGFTLLELLITLGIIVVLTALYWNNSAGNQDRKKRLCAQNLQKIYLALEIYANDHSGQFPATAGAQTSEQPLDALVPRYTSDTSIFTCPAGRDSTLPPGQPIRDRRISYAYYMGRRLGDTPESLMSDRQTDTASKTAGHVAFSQNGKPPGNNHSDKGGNVLFSDGHVEWSPASLGFSLVLTQGVVLLNPKP